MNDWTETATTQGGNGQDQPHLVRPDTTPQTDRYTAFGDIGEDTLNMTWLVQDVIAQGNFYQVFGRYKSGKSLVTMDMCCHLAAGMPHWGGRPITQAVVVWVAGESLMAVKRRLYAWRLRHQVDGRHVAFYLRDRAMYLNQAGMAADLGAEIAVFSSLWPGLPVLVVMDTLAANMEGNENSVEDMQPWCNHFVEYVLKPHKAAGIAVHHSGHADDTRGRGSSALPAAVDGSLKVSKQGEKPATLTLHPQETRDNGEDSDLHFRIDTHELPFRDNFDRQVVAPVLFPLESAPPDNRDKGLGSAQEACLAILDTEMEMERRRLRALGADETEEEITFEQWRTACKTALAFKDNSHWKKIWESLRDRNLIEVSGGCVYRI